MNSKPGLYKTVLLLVFVVLSGFLATWGESNEKAEAYMVEVKAFDYAFDAPAEIPSGWITFVLNNEMGHEVHEISIGRLPEEVSFEEYLSEYVGPWEVALQEFQNEDIERAELGERVGELLPDWGDDVKFINARGLVSSGRKAEKTVFLEAGTYAMDCWVKTPEGIIHISNGMTRPFTITEEAAGSPEPSPTSAITLQQEEIEIDWEPETGKHSFALYFEEGEDGGAVHNNIHLIKTDKNTDLDEVNRWMDWYRVGGLRGSAPAEFLGGVSTYDSEPGEDATYFSLTINEPGEYAWIVQVPEDQQLWKKFTVE